MASNAWNTASPAAGGVCMIRLAIRPAKSFSNHPTDCRSTCLCARQRISVPKFGRIVLFSNITSNACIAGRIRRMKTATTMISVPYCSHTSIGSPARISTIRPM